MSIHLVPAPFGRLVNPHHSPVLIVILDSGQSTKHVSFSLSLSWLYWSDQLQHSPQK